MNDRDLNSLDRHALVMALWLGFAFLAVTLLKLGIEHASWWALGLGFASVLTGFIAHVLVNVAFGTRFTQKEVALGLSVFAICLLWFGLAVIFYPQHRVSLFAPIAIGFMTLTASVIFTMITWLGLRGAFESFDIIRRFAPEKRP
jgi:uncharacterized PurR-regulated membrane protein YhhQ (DUF165 family)